MHIPLSLRLLVHTIIVTVIVSIPTFLLEDTANHITTISLVCMGVIMGITMALATSYQNRRDVIFYVGAVLLVLGVVIAIGGLAALGQFFLGLLIGYAISLLVNAATKE